MLQVVLYPDNLPVEIPEELQICLSDKPAAHKTFLGFTGGEQKAFITWICSSKNRKPD